MTFASAIHANLTGRRRSPADGFGRSVTDTTGANGDGFKYTGREWDATAQLQYNRARYYDPAIGKWISIDPLGFDAGDANLYRYCGNGATNGVDPSGLKKGDWSWGGAFLGFAAGGIVGGVIGGLLGPPSGVHIAGQAGIATPAGGFSVGGGWDLVEIGGEYYWFPFIQINPLTVGNTVACPFTWSINAGPLWTWGIDDPSQYLGTTPNWSIDVPGVPVGPIGVGGYGTSSINSTIGSASSGASVGSPGGSGSAGFSIPLGSIHTPSLVFACIFPSEYLFFEFGRLLR